MASHGEDVSNLFAEHFKNIYFSSGAQSNTFGSFSDNNPNLLVTHEKVRNIIKDLDTRKSAGPDGIPALFIKSCIDSLILPLVFVYDLSLKRGFPIYNSGDRTNVAPSNK